jgi:hypothetical protein
MRVALQQPEGRQTRNGSWCNRLIATVVVGGPDGRRGASRVQGSVCSAISECACSSVASSTACKKLKIGFPLYLLRNGS